VYWQSLLRDVPLTELRDDTESPDVLAACEELTRLSDFRGPKNGGRVTPSTLFRASALYFDAADAKGRSVTPPGVLDGPLISQFLLRDIPYGSQFIGAQMRTASPASEFLTDYEEWLATQNGEAPRRQIKFDPTLRYIATGRDLAEYVHNNPAFAWGASLLLGTAAGGPDHATPVYIRRRRLRCMPQIPTAARGPKFPRAPPSGCPMCRRCSHWGRLTPPVEATGRSITFTGLCGRKPMAGWRTSV
jgi:hypothetical protein